MPIYEYRCSNGHVNEALVWKSTDAPTLMICPECDGPAERIVSRTSWAWGEGPKESNVSAAIKRVKKAEREGRA